MPFPVIFGILNITEDSFSDGAKYLAPEAAIAHARKLTSEGADVIDLGAASSNPDAIAVAPEVEIARLAPVVDELKREGIAISIDTFAPEVQRWALAQGVDYLNDVRGFPDAAIYPGLAESPAKLIVMHSVQERGPATRVRVPAETLMDRILAIFERRITALTKAGIARHRLILDPGMGLFLGTDKEASFTVLRGIPQLKRAFGLPILISVSRKSFLRRLTGKAPLEAGPASLAAELFAARQGTDCIRTHDPGALRDALTVWQALATETDGNAA
ncbi:MAG TPA: dihydropteroate synthase [Rhizomicrobium sp.]|jgi:dihydropteroate synthase type 2|nr:dihydropteroate synthase [Rhizomicrobium sp.]